jgi:hypothetical protein
MASTGFLTATTVTELPLNEVGWTNPNDAIVQDGTYATITLTAGTASHVLAFGGFPVTAGAFEILGIQARSVAINFDLQPATVYLTKNGTDTVGTPKQFTQASGFQTVGSSTDLWGTTFTPSEIMAPTFGAMIYVFSDANQGFSLDTLNINVHYTLAGGFTIKPYTIGYDYVGRGE